MLIGSTTPLPGPCRSRRQPWRLQDLQANSPGAADGERAVLVGSLIGAASRKLSPNEPYAEARFGEAATNVASVGEKTILFPAVRVAGAILAREYGDSSW